MRHVYSVACVLVVGAILALIGEVIRQRERIETLEMRDYCCTKPKSCCCKEAESCKCILQVGPAGVVGKDGRDGIDGKDGLPGTDGVNGKDGSPGVAGKNGKDGETKHYWYYHCR